MKKVLAVLLASVVSPLIAFAASNDVQITSGGTLVMSVGGSNLEFTLSSGEIESLNANASSVDFTLAPGSAMSISSADRRTFDYQVGRAIASVACDSDSSDLGISLKASEPSNETITVTPTVYTCKTESGGAGGGSSGGGGSSTPAPEPTPTPAPEPALAPVPTPSPVVAQVPAAEVAQPSPIAQLVSPVFNSDLSLGSRGDDVKRLQELLKSDKELYPEGLVTGYFGPLTKAAVLKFQLKYGVVNSASDQGAGRFGPKTRAKAKEVFGNGTPAAVQTPAASAPSPASTASPTVQSLNEQIQMLLKQVQELQAKLKAQQGY